MRPCIVGSVKNTLMLTPTRHDQIKFVCPYKNIKIGCDVTQSLKEHSQSGVRFQKQHQAGFRQNDLSPILA